jgi:glycosyltransferase involved in cell wall biosynthesis
MTAMKHILILSNSRIIGGAEVVLKDYLESENTNCFILFTNYYLNDYYSSLPNNVKIITRPYFKRSRIPFIRAFNFLIYLVRNIFLINSIIKNNKINIVYGNNSMDSYLVYFVKLFNHNIKTIVHIHDTITSHDKIRHFLKFAINKFDAIFVPSRHTKAALEKFTGKSNAIRVIHNGINPDILQKTKIVKQSGKTKQFTLLTVGRVDKNKRLDIFIQSISELANKGYHVQGIIAGDVTDQDIYNDLCRVIKQNKITVSFTGPLSRTEIFQLYRSSDCTMVNSDAETFSMATIEAMAHKCIVLARKVGGIKDIIINNKNGFFYPYNSNIKQIVKTLEIIISLNTIERNRITNNGYNHIFSCFLLKNKIALISKIFNSL